jgi:cardiolipin synthase (CMP-forming)
MADDDAPAEGEDRILTIPNLLSVGRLLCIPLFLWLLFAKEDRARAAYLLGALGATDWVDGYVARHFNQVSTLGKVLDPTADRLLLGVGIVAILIDGSVPRWIAVMVLVREVLVGAAVVALAALGASRIDVTWFGKAGTFFNMFAFPLFLGGASGISWNDTARTLGWVFAIPGLILSYYAAVLYIPAARKALREGRSGRQPKVA